MCKPVKGATVGQRLQKLVKRQKVCSRNPNPADGATGLQEGAKARKGSEGMSTAASICEKWCDPILCAIKSLIGISLCRAPHYRYQIIRSRCESKKTALSSLSESSNFEQALGFLKMRRVANVDAPLALVTGNSSWRLALALAAGPSMPRCASNCQGRCDAVCKGERYSVSASWDGWLGADGLYGWRRCRKVVPTLESLLVEGGLCSKKDRQRLNAALGGQRS